VHALAAPMAPVIALTALAALGLSGTPFHEPFHAKDLEAPPPPDTVRNLTEALIPRREQTQPSRPTVLQTSDGTALTCANKRVKQSPGTHRGMTRGLGAGYLTGQQCDLRTAVGEPTAVVGLAWLRLPIGGGWGVRLSSRLLL